MSTTLTIRLAEEERARLKKRALREKKSESQLVRELIANMDASPMFNWERVKHLAGSVSIDYTRNPVARVLRERNWRS